MGKPFTFNEIEKIALAAGFQLDSANAGSHQIYKQNETDLRLTIPKHNAGVSAGVAENIVKMSVLASRICNINIGSYKNKFSSTIHEMIVEHQAKCKENPLHYLPDDYREKNKIETPQQVFKFIESFGKKQAVQKYNDYGMSL